MFEIDAFILGIIFLISICNLSAKINKCAFFVNISFFCVAKMYKLQISGGNHDFLNIYSIIFFISRTWNPQSLNFRSLILMFMEKATMHWKYNFHWTLLCNIFICILMRHVPNNSHCFSCVFDSNANWLARNKCNICTLSLRSFRPPYLEYM